MLCEQQIKTGNALLRTKSQPQKEGVRWPQQLFATSKQENRSLRTSRISGVSIPALTTVLLLCLIGNASAVLTIEDCDAIGHTGGINAANGGCLCQSYYVWTPSNNTCQLNCGLIANTTTKISNTQCGCSSGVWDTKSYSCVASCPTKTIYNAVYKACVPDCVNINYTTNLSNWLAYPNRIGYRCACLPAFVWNYNTQVCECPVGTTLVPGVSPNCTCGTVTPPNSTIQAPLARNVTSGKCSCPVGTVTNISN